MMDYRLKWRKDASFTYVIPLDAKTALIEFTLFNTTLIEDKDYDVILKKYIHEILKINEYTIEEVEKGIIPMSDYPFHQHSTNSITKIGTAGGWVKPSSGYSFKNAQENSARIVALLKKGVAIPANFRSARFEFYDSIFLSVLSKDNNLGESIFTAMYTKNNVQDILKFLDEKTTLLEEINIIRKFDWLPFLKGLFRITNRK
jgi:lycopene beta-cyclase